MTIGPLPIIKIERMLLSRGISWLDKLGKSNSGIQDFLNSPKKILPPQEQTIVTELLSLSERPFYRQHSVAECKVHQAAMLMVG